MYTSKRSRYKKDTYAEMHGLLQYKAQLSEIKENAIETMETAKRRDGLEFIDVDVASLKPKL